MSSLIVTFLDLSTHIQWNNSKTYERIDEEEIKWYYIYINEYKYSIVIVKNETNDNSIHQLKINYYVHNIYSWHENPVRICITL